MGLFGFGKKEKKRCPICGGEMGLFSTKLLRDGEICESCEQMIRGQFDIEEYWRRRLGTDGRHREDYKLVHDDPMSCMTVDEVRAMIEEKKALSAEAEAEFGFDYDNLARVESCFSIAPGPLQVGIKRSRELKGRVVATSMIVSGEMKRGDAVTLISGGWQEQTTVLDVIPCSSSSTFETELGANIGKHKAGEGVNAWVILDVTVDLPAGTMICR